MSFLPPCRLADKRASPLIPLAILLCSMPHQEMCTPHRSRHPSSSASSQQPTASTLACPPDRAVAHPVSRPLGSDASRSPCRHRQSCRTYSCLHNHKSLSMSRTPVAQSLALIYTSLGPSLLRARARALPQPAGAGAPTPHAPPAARLTTALPIRPIRGHLPLPARCRHQLFRILDLVSLLPLTTCDQGTSHLRIRPASTFLALQPTHSTPFSQVPLPDLRYLSSLLAAKPLVHCIHIQRRISSQFVISRNLERVKRMPHVQHFHHLAANYASRTAALASDPDGRHGSLYHIHCKTSNGWLSENLQ